MKKSLINDTFFKKKLISYFLFRHESILPFSYEFSFKVHSGIKLKKIKLNKFSIFKKAGEFSFSRKPYFFPIKKK